MRGGFRNRRRNGPPYRLIAGGAAVLALVGAVFWFAGQAESDRPPQTELRVEAMNVGSP